MMNRALTESYVSVWKKYWPETNHLLFTLVY